MAKTKKQQRELTVDEQRVAMVRARLENATIADGATAIRYVPSEIPEVKVVIKPQGPNPLNPAYAAIVERARIQAAKPRKTKRGRTPKLCACGCERMTKGGTWWPGDDAVFHGRVMDGIRAGMTEVEAVAAAIATAKPKAAVAAA